MKLRVQYDIQTCRNDRIGDADQDKAIAAFENRLGNLLIPAVLAWQFCGGCDAKGFYNADGELETDETLIALWRAFTDAEPANGTWQTISGVRLDHWEREHIEDDPECFYWPASALLNPAIVVS